MMLLFLPVVIVTFASWGTTLFCFCGDSSTTVLTSLMLTLAFIRPYQGSEILVVQLAA